MHPFPHRYRVECTATPAAPEVVVESPALLPLLTTAPPEFDGPAGYWSPETLLVAAVADCYALTFRGLARSAGLSWATLTVDAAGTLDRRDRITRFTRIDIVARLAGTDGTDETLARRVLARAEETCLITRSLSAEIHLDADVTRVAEVTAAP